MNITHDDREHSQRLNQIDMEAKQKAILYLQSEIMLAYRGLMIYDDQLRNIMFDDVHDLRIVQDCVDNFKERIEMYETILEHLEK
jgi:hypothetical protein